MKQLLFTAAFYSLFLISCAGQKNTVRAQAFYRESIPGREPRGIDGAPMARPHDTLHFVYVELKSNSTPVVESAVYFGAKVSAALYPLQPSELFVGVTKDGGERVELKPAAGKSWWRVELNGEDTRGKKGRRGKIIVVGKEEEGKTFRVELEKETALKPEIRG